MKVMLQDVRLAFPEIFEPAQFQGEGDAAYSATLIIDPKVTRALSDGKPVKLDDVISKVAAEKWGAKAEQALAWAREKGKIQFRKEPKRNTSGEIYAGFENTWHVSCRGDTRPLVLNRDKTPVTAKDGVVYAGCYVNAIVRFFAWDNKYGKGIGCELTGVQFLRDGDAFSGGAPASADDFADLTAGADADSLV